jgi:riboflavin synthase
LILVVNFGVRPRAMLGRTGEERHMFTGIIEGLGTLEAVKSGGLGKQITLAADFDLDGTGIGDSIAVNGACLTVVRLKGRRFDVDVSPETMARTTLGQARVGERLNLERALRLSDRLDGHLVAGHVDGLGRLDRRETIGNAVILSFSCAAQLSRQMITKGSVAVDGISLTINDCATGSFQVSIIPHTARMTTIGFKAAGAAVNIETDIIGKYVERFVAGGYQPEPKSDGAGIDLNLLAKSGFLNQ